MRTREMSYSDYGLSKDEVEYIKRFCKNAGEEERKIIRTALSELCPYIAKKCYDSLVEDKSYEDLSMKEYVFFGKGDFYGYRRRGMDAIKRWMILYGIWEM